MTKPQHQWCEVTSTRTVAVKGRDTWADLKDPQDMEPQKTETMVKQKGKGETGDNDQVAGLDSWMYSAITIQ